MRNIWQVSGGPLNRSYFDVFLRFGVALIGPGDAGPWRSDRNDAEFEGSFVRRFATEVQIGDVFLLRLGLSRIVALGIVASDYLYLTQFDEVNGWDLQHARRVLWLQLPQPHDFEQSVFGGSPRRFGSISHPTVLDYANRFINSPPVEWQSAPLPPLPEEEPPLDVIPPELADIVATAQDLAGNLYWDRQAFGDHPTEDEILVHLVVPFFRALGWPPEQIAIKWRYIDLALFRSLPRTPDNCLIVVEAKQLGAGVEGALDQAKSYIASLGVVRDIVVTDGARYRMYSGENEFAPLAYANLWRLKKSATDLFNRFRRA